MWWCSPLRTPPSRKQHIRLNPMGLCRDHWTKKQPLRQQGGGWAQRRSELGRINICSDRAEIQGSQHVESLGLTERYDVMATISWFASDAVSFAARVSVRHPQAR